MSMPCLPASVSALLLPFRPHPGRSSNQELVKGPVSVTFTVLTSA